MNKISKTKKIALITIMVSINMLGNLISAKIPQIPFLGRFTFLYLFAAVTGFSLGPMYAACTLALADAIIAIIAPRGVFNPLIVLSNAWIGFFCAIIYRKIKLNFTIRHIIAFIAIAVLFTYTANTIAHVFYHLVLLKGNTKTYETFIKTSANSDFFSLYLFLVVRRLPQSFFIVLNGIIAYPVIIRLKKRFKNIFIEDYQKEKIVDREIEILKQKNSIEENIDLI